MYSSLVHLLQELKPPYILLIQACIIVAFPYFLWRTLQLGRWFPLGVVQIFSGVLLGPGLFGAFDAAFLNPSPSFDPAKAVNACVNPQARELFNALFGTTCYHGDRSSIAQPASPRSRPSRSACSDFSPAPMLTRS